MTSEPIDIPRPATAPERQTISVLEETARVVKRLVETDRARVRISVTEHDEAVEALLMRQDLAIDRVAVGTMVTAAPPVRQEGNTFVFPVLEERLVVEKRLFLIEELRIRIDETQTPEKQVVRLRREHAVIDRDDVVRPTQERNPE